MRAVIYGIGQEYYDFLNNLSFVRKGLIENDIQVIGISDSNKASWGTTVIFAGKEFIV